VADISTTSRKNNLSRLHGVDQQFQFRQFKLPLTDKVFGGLPAIAT